MTIVKTIKSRVICSVWKKLCVYFSWFVWKSQSVKAIVSVSYFPVALWIASMIVRWLARSTDKTALKRSDSEKSIWLYRLSTNVIMKCVCSGDWLNNYPILIVALLVAPWFSQPTLTYSCFKSQFEPTDSCHEAIMASHCVDKKAVEQ